MKPEPGISLVLLRPIVGCFAQLGGDPKLLLAVLGVADNADVDTFVPASRIASALDRIGGGASLGLELGKAAQVGSLGFLDYLFLASTNLREALLRTRRLYALASQIVTLSIEEDLDAARVFHMIDPGAPRVVAATEFIFAAFVTRARVALGERFGLRSVRFTHAVTDPRPFQMFFKVPVAFEQADDEIVFDAAALSVQFHTADPAMVALVETHAARLAAKFDVADTTRARARVAIARGLRDRRLRITQVARELRVSTRSLQRALGLEGTSFRDLVAEVQRDVALQLLARDELSVVEVAYATGFSQHAAFHRAFVRWTGSTPGAFRAGRRER